jgi:hypothetical protein
VSGVPFNPFDDTVVELNNCQRELKGVIGELKGVIERVHEVVHPDRSSAVDVPERPNVVMPPSNVAH